MSSPLRGTHSKTGQVFWAKRPRGPFEVEHPKSHIFNPQKVRQTPLSFYSHHPPSPAGVKGGEGGKVLIEGRGLGVFVSLSLPC